MSTTKPPTFEVAKSHAIPTNIVCLLMNVPPKPNSPFRIAMFSRAFPIITDCKILLESHERIGEFDLDVSYGRILLINKIHRNDVREFTIYNKNGFRGIGPDISIVLDDDINDEKFMLNVFPVIRDRVMFM